MIKKKIGIHVKRKLEVLLVTLWIMVLNIKYACLQLVAAHKNLV